MTEQKQAGFISSAARDGKLGLALSGGGFRAALFHVGVLAQMAEKDLLRHVSVISTVSGGSIIGAFYYLKLKQLLEGRREDNLVPSAEGFLQLVQEIEREFLVAVQHNLRLATFADPRQNARMLGDKYSSTMRLADLFNQYFYSPVTGGSNHLLTDLPISPVLDPAAESCQFVVPKLVINATALNTGHLFQFTTAYVGESRISLAVGDTPDMPILRRLALDDPALDAGQRQHLHRISIGDAVAASCCVPGLLDPFSLGGLYRDKEHEEVVVRLVDGGVFDNQGLVSLYEEGCTHFISSDASDLLKWQAHPEEQIHNVAMRANDIMMDRIRNELMDKLSRREEENYVIITLGDQADIPIFHDDFHVIKALGAIRTDLDAFTDLEASTLMYYGFRLSEQRFTSAVAANADHWRFSAARDMEAEASGREKLLRALEVGSRQFMKIFYLGRPLPYLILVIPMIIPVALLGLLIYMLPPVPLEVWVVLALLGLIGIAFSQNARIIEKLDQFPAFTRFRRRLAVIMRPLGMTVMLGMLGAGVCRVNLRVFNRLFLKYGRLHHQAKASNQGAGRG